MRYLIVDLPKKNLKHSIVDGATAVADLGGQEGAVAPSVRLISFYPNVNLSCPPPPFAPTSLWKLEKIVIFALNQPTNIHFAPFIYESCIRHRELGST